MVKLREGTDCGVGGIQKATMEVGVELEVDESGTAALYRSHVPAAVRLAYLLTGDEASAHDVAHDAFLKSASQLRTMRDPDRFPAYLRRTVVRTVLMRRRSSHREAARVEQAVYARPQGGADPFEASSDHIDLIAALRTLPARQQSVLVLRYWLDLPEGEIARAMGCRPGTVKSTLARGLEGLRKVVPNV